jgi:hypothetical protein
LGSQWPDTAGRSGHHSAAQIPRYGVARASSQLNVRAAGMPRDQEESDYRGRAAGAQTLTHLSERVIAWPLRVHCGTRRPGAATSRLARTPVLTELNATQRQSCNATRGKGRSGDLGQMPHPSTAPFAPTEHVHDTVALRCRARDSSSHNGLSGNRVANNNRRDTMKLPRRQF